MNIDDWYEGSKCAACGKEECWGECPNYDDYMLTIPQDDEAPSIPCLDEQSES